jgi:hypothetical protein
MLGLGAMLVAAPSARAEIVYRNDNPDWAFYQPQNEGEQIGDDVTLAGTARNVTQFSVRLTNAYLQSYNGTFTARFFLPNGAGGTPGTQIWSGDLQVTNGPAGTMVGADRIPTDNILTWNVPGVLVPDRFIWSLQMDTNLPPADPTSDDGIGLVLNDTPQVGSSQDVAYYFDPTTGTWFDYNYHPDLTDLANLQATIVAQVPEPVGLLTIGAIGLLGRRRRV